MLVFMHQQAIYGHGRPMTIMILKDVYKRQEYTSPHAAAKERQGDKTVIPSLH